MRENFFSNYVNREVTITEPVLYEFGDAPKLLGRFATFLRVVADKTIVISINGGDQITLDPDVEYTYSGSGNPENVKVINNVLITPSESTEIFVYAD